VKFQKPGKSNLRRINPADLAGVVGRILSRHVGLSWAVKRGDILQQVQQLHTLRLTTDRMIRGAIEYLREAGWLICNLMDDTVYFLAGSPEEYQQFRSLYVSYATTIWARTKAMDKAAEKRWGSGALQERMF
jgi:hypothetical protein